LSSTALFADSNSVMNDQNDYAIMTTEELENWACEKRADIVLKLAKPGVMVKYAGSLYEVARTERGMVGIYDEPPSKHVDFINPRNLTIPRSN
jgi:hypothetical protein